jgi:hypothetical protein
MSIEAMRWKVTACAAALSLAVGYALIAPTAAAAPPLGDANVEATADPSALGTAEANRFVATGSANVTSLLIYVDPSNRATTLALGIYTDAAGAPGQLIAQGSTSAVPAGSWAAVTIAPTPITAGTPYWIARLALAGGDLVTRVDPATPNPDRSDTRVNATLPSSFSPGGSWPHLTSMYASAGAPSQTSTPAPTTAPSPPPPPGSVGDAVIESTPDGSSIGVVEANRFIASAGGVVSSITIYLDASNRATSIALGLYSDGQGAPASLIASGARAGVQNGAWNAVTIPTSTITAGTAYWIARLSTAGGDLVTRVNPAATDPDRVDTRSSTSLPSTFSPGASYPHRTAMYAGAAGTPPAPTASPTPVPFTCTQVMGYSQTGNWYSLQVTNAFESRVVDSRYQLLSADGGAIWKWADPGFAGWSNAPFSPCASGSAAPDRVIFDVTESFWINDPSAHPFDDYGGNTDLSVARVAQDIRDLIATLRAKYPSVREIYLQSVLGAPADTPDGLCYVTDSQGVRHAIRGTWNNPYIEQAIQQVVGGIVRAGPHTAVRSCADFYDDGQYVGHLDPATDAKSANGQIIGGFYSTRP